MRLPGGYCCSHLHAVCADVHVRSHMHARPCRSTQTNTILVFMQSLGHGAGQEIYVLCRPDTVPPARCSLRLLHGHTCYSNKLYGAPLQSLMDSRGGVSSLCARTQRRRHNAWSIAKTSYLHRSRERTTGLFRHISWLAAFSRPGFNDPFTHIKIDWN